ncbi:hypothetical protein [Celeribacter arenosi]|uniref:Uncharacterized protein n=1 Tax=Celeribacter arenosi TaxID=792649 RepID=A0ABP7K6G9_9RHOB
MFKFLRFGRGHKAEVAIESQRQTFERLVSELNEALDTLPDKPAVTIDPATGHVAFDLPEHFPDEALALPAPTPAEKGEDVIVDEAAEEVAETAEAAEDAVEDVVETAVEKAAK